MSSLKCGVDVLPLRAVEPDLRYYTRDACIAALNRFMAKAQHDATHQLGLRSGHLLETNGSDTLAGGFVKYAVLITRPSRADPLK